MFPAVASMPVTVIDVTVGVGCPVEALMILNWSLGKPLTVPPWVGLPVHAAVPVLDVRETVTPAVGVVSRQDVETVS